MNARGNENRSVQHTKRRLYEAFVTLALQKSIGAITVRELTALAGVSRGTFYFHYTDIYELVHELEQLQIDQLNLLLDALLPQVSSTATPDALCTLFKYLNENSGVCRALLGDSGDPVFALQLQTVIAERCLGYMVPSGKETARQKYLMSFSVHGCIGCIKAWFSDGRKEPAEEMADNIWQIIRMLFSSISDENAPA